MTNLTLQQLRNKREDLRRLYNEEGEAVNAEAEEVQGVPTIEDWWEQYGKKEYPDLAKQRDFESEREAMERFKQEAGFYPSKPQDIATTAQMAYEEPPQELVGGGSQEALKARMAGAREEAFGKAKTAQEAGRTAQPRLDILQDALKEKTGSYDASIGKSEIFQKAGVGGMGALMQSLNSRRKEINNSYERFRRTTRDMATIISSENQELMDKADRSLKRYEMLKEKYENGIDRMQELEGARKKHERNIQLIHEKARIDRQQSLLEHQLDSIEEGGVEYDTDEPINYWASQQGLKTEQQLNDLKFSDNVPSWYVSEVRQKLQSGEISREQLTGKQSRALTRDDFQNLWNQFRSQGLSQTESLEISPEAETKLKSKYKQLTNTKINAIISQINANKGKKEILENMVRNGLAKSEYRAEDMYDNIVESVASEPFQDLSITGR